MINAGSFADNAILASLGRLPKNRPNPAVHAAPFGA